MTEINAKDLKSLQDKGEKLLVQFSAVWCGPCKTLTPRLMNLSNEYENVTFVKIDVDNGLNSELVVELGIMSIPTVVFYNGHKMVDRVKGLETELFYKNILGKL